MLLTVLVSLNLDNHLLQAVDGLVTALLRNLVLEVTFGTVSALASLVLGLVGDVLPGLVAQVACTLTGTMLGVHARVATLLLITVRKLGGISGVTGACGVSGLSGITKSIFGITPAEWLLLVVLAFSLRLQVVL